MDHETKVVDPNEKHKIMSFKVRGETVRVYLLNPGSFFQGFGGSSSGLEIRKTASLIVSTIGVHGSRDVEYDVDNKAQWESILCQYRRACGLME